MDDLGKIQKLKRFLEDNGLDFPEEANYGKRMNRKSKFTFVLYSYYPITFRQRSSCKSRAS